jgi:hypothetical protein
MNYRKLWSRVLLDNLTIKNIVQSEATLLYSQRFATGPHSESDENSQRPQILYFKINFNIMLPPTRKSLSY